MRVVVVGAGGMGTAAAAHLARRGAEVHVFDPFHLAHDRGSSHGSTRLIRKAYFESPSYVPLLQRAYALWDELGDATGEHLLHRTGVLLMSRAEGRADRRAEARRVAELHGIAVQTLDAPELRRSFPAFVHTDDSVGLFEPDAGYLDVEASLRAHTRLAERHGAKFHWGEGVTRIESNSNSGSHVVHTAKRVLETDRVVVAAGPWTQSLLADLGVHLVVHRVVQFWYAAGAPYRLEDGLPCFAFDEGGTFVYGFPSLPGVGLKIAEHKPASPVSNPDDVERSVGEREAQVVLGTLARHFRGFVAAPTSAKTCLYTMSPDEHFVVDHHPSRRGVVVAAGFSGHGFKFASVIGEILADLALEGRTQHPIEFLSAKRPFGSA